MKWMPQRLHSSLESHFSPFTPSATLQIFIGNNRSPRRTFWPWDSTLSSFRSWLQVRLYATMKLPHNLQRDNGIHYKLQKAWKDLQPDSRKKWFSPTRLPILPTQYLLPVFPRLTRPPLGSELCVIRCISIATFLDIAIWLLDLEKCLALHFQRISISHTAQNRFRIFGIDGTWRSADGFVITCIFQTYRNLFIVFFLTGLWHGASWTMIVWGLFHGFFLVLERLSLGKILPKLFFLNRVYTLLVVMIAWVFFKSPDIHFAVSYISSMFGDAHVELGDTLHYKQFLTIDFVLLFCLAVVGASGISQDIIRRYEDNRFMQRAYSLLTPISYAGSLVLLVICSMIITRQGYNPFIYFQFWWNDCSPFFTSSCSAQC